MAFDASQSSYIALREIIAQRTKQYIAWTGSGLSASVGIPTWPYLRDKLTEEAEAHVNRMNPQDLEKNLPRISLIKSENDPWLAFELLKNLLGDANYKSAVRKEIGTPNKIPPIYERIWNLKFGGCLTLNLDRLATNAYTACFKGSAPIEFAGRNVGEYTHILQSANPFITNLHGMLDNAGTWVFTRTELQRLCDNQAYNTFLDICLGSRVVVFIGISADDVAAGGHLDRLKQKGINLGDHFWITHRNDQETMEWASSVGLRTIHYSSNNNSHQELYDLFNDIEAYVPSDTDAIAVAPTSLPDAKGSEYLPPVDELIKLPSSNIRNLLNYSAKEILSSSDKNSFDRYRDFINQYRPAIYRAWYVSTTAPDNDLLGIELTRSGLRGGFGHIYEASGRNKERLAVKILHQEIMEEPNMLASFRRGVRAMQILSRRKVNGMVPYIDAYEIPACAVMEYIDGPNIREAVESKIFDDWHTILEFGIQLSDVIRSAHALPEQVLHRDLRPSNIMLRKYYETSQIDVVVLDFDLSWYRDAVGTSIENPNAQSGFVSPEQVDKSINASSRNALVDSYGLGMTLYYVRNCREPIFGQPNHADWRNILIDMVKKHPCPTWHSLPRRFARILENASRYEQNLRWDMTQIHGELSRIYQVLQDPSSITSAEMLAEEVASRLDLSGSYKWFAENLTATYKTPAGYSIGIRGDESNQMVVLKVGAVNTQMDRYKNVAKYAQRAIDQSERELRKGGWSINQRTHTVAGHEIEASISVYTLAKDIDNAAKCIREVFDIFAFK